MNTNLTYINSTFISIFVNPKDMEDYEQTIIKEPKYLNLTSWNATRFVNRTLNINMTFFDPLQISKFLDYDNISFHVINNSDIFRSANGLVLDLDSKNLTKKIVR